MSSRQPSSSSHSSPRHQSHPGDHCGPAAEWPREWPASTLGSQSCSTLLQPGQHQDLGFACAAPSSVGNISEGQDELEGIASEGQEWCDFGWLNWDLNLDVDRESWDDSGNLKVSDWTLPRSTAEWSPMSACLADMTSLTENTVTEAPNGTPVLPWLWPAKVGSYDLLTLPLRWSLRAGERLPSQPRLRPSTASAGPIRISLDLFNHPMPDKPFVFGRRKLGLRFA